VNGYFSTCNFVIMTYVFPMVITAECRMWHFML